MVKALTFKGDPKKKKRKRVDPSEKFGDSTTTSKSDPSSSKQLSTINDEADAEDTSWVSADTPADLNGPIIFVLPSNPPSALSCDSNGSVFALELENLIDANPATAEPHDVRQVWVVSRVAGTENFSFKGHHGKWLGCDKHGILSAEREAVSPAEQFEVFNTPSGMGEEGTFQMKTLRDTYITINAAKRNSAVPEIRGDAEEVGFNTTMRIRMQAKYKPKLKKKKEEVQQSKVSRKELEEAVGRKLEDDEVRTLKRARREGDYHEKLLDVKVKGKHDKYS